MGDDQVRYLPLHWSLGAEFRQCFSTLTYIGLFPKQLSSIADLHCMLWKAELLQATQAREDKARGQRRYPPYTPYSIGNFENGDEVTSHASWMFRGGFA